MGSGHDHGHDHGAGANSRMLAIALGFTGTFLVAELIGAYVFDSLALLSDAAHMFTDAAALAIALAAVKIGQKPADDKRTYGYRRFRDHCGRVQCRVAVRGGGLRAGRRHRPLFRSAAGGNRWACWPSLRSAW